MGRLLVRAPWLAEVAPGDGTVVRTVDVALQGISSELSGLAFDGAGTLLGQFDE